MTRLAIRRRSQVAAKTLAMLLFCVGRPDDSQFQGSRSNSESTYGTGMTRPAGCCIAQSLPMYKDQHTSYRQKVNGNSSQELLTGRTWQKVVQYTQLRSCMSDSLIRPALTSDEQSICKPTGKRQSQCHARFASQTTYEPASCAQPSLHAYIVTFDQFELLWNVGINIPAYR